MLSLPGSKDEKEPELSTTQMVPTTMVTAWHVRVQSGPGLQLSTLSRALACFALQEWKGNVKEGYGRHTFDDGKVYDGSGPLGPTGGGSHAQ